MTPGLKNTIICSKCKDQLSVVETKNNFLNLEKLKKYGFLKLFFVKLW